MKKRNINRHKIRFTEDNDILVALLGELGWSTKAIMRRTELRQCQVTYRLAKASVRRMDYRNGTSATATTVLEAVRPIVEPKLKRELPKLFT